MTCIKFIDCENNNLCFEDLIKLLVVYCDDGEYYLKVKADSLKFIINTIDADYTADGEDQVILVDAGAGNIIVTLPDAGDCEGRGYRIKVIDNNGNLNTVDVTPAGGNIDGAANYDLDTLYDAIDVISDGTDWWVF